MTSEYDKIAAANQTLMSQMEELKKIHQETSANNSYLAKQTDKLQQENANLRSTLETVKVQSELMQRTLEERNSQLSN